MLFTVDVSCDFYVVIVSKFYIVQILLNLSVWVCVSFGVLIFFFGWCWVMYDS